MTWPESTTLRGIWRRCLKTRARRDVAVGSGSGGTRAVWAWGAALATLLAATAEAQHAPAPVAPNLLLVSIDTLRADHTTPYGHEHDTTPGLAALAAQGVLFENAYAPTSSTGPSHATLFTGRHPVSHGLRKNGLPLATAARTLAEILRENGYQTAGVVSSVVLDARFGLDQGFDVWEDDFSAEGASFNPRSWEGHAVPNGFDRRADETTKLAQRWLWIDRDPQRPFALFVHYFDPHTPYDPPATYSRRFPLAPPEAGAPKRLNDLDVRLEVRAYEGEIAFADREVARLVETIDRLGLAADTLVVVTADHGEGLFDHAFRLHGIDVYEESVRVPLVVRWPGHVPTGRRIAAPVGLADLAPTILDLLGVARGPEGADGRSLAAALRGEASLPADGPVFFYRGPFQARIVEGIPVRGELHGVRRGAWKLIEHTSGDGDELYDLSRDPGERDNRLAEAPEIRERLSALLSRLRTRASDGVPRLSEENRRALEALGYVE